MEDLSNIRAPKNFRPLCCTYLHQPESVLYYIFTLREDSWTTMYTFTRPIHTLPRVSKYPTGLRTTYTTRVHNCSKYTLKWIVNYCQYYYGQLYAPTDHNSQCTYFRGQYVTLPSDTSQQATYIFAQPARSHGLQTPEPQPQIENFIFSQLCATCNRIYFCISHVGIGIMHYPFVSSSRFTEHPPTTSTYQQEYQSEKPDYLLLIPH
eukprot:588207-Amorphochlora_amoeboformis.AAC.2